MLAPPSKWPDVLAVTSSFPPPAPYQNDSVSSWRAHFCATKQFNSLERKLLGLGTLARVNAFAGMLWREDRRAQVLQATAPLVAMLVRRASRTGSRRTVAPTRRQLSTLCAARGAQPTPEESLTATYKDPPGWPVNRQAIQVLLSAPPSTTKSHPLAFPQLIYQHHVLQGHPLHRLRCPRCHGCRPGPRGEQRTDLLRRRYLLLPQRWPRRVRCPEPEHRPRRRPQRRPVRRRRELLPPHRYPLQRPVCRRHRRRPLPRLRLRQHRPLSLRLPAARLSRRWSHPGLVGLRVMVSRPLHGGWA